MKPLFKDLHLINRLNDTTIRIGSTADSSFDIEDKDGSIYLLLQLLNGKNTIKQIHKLLLQEGYQAIQVDDIAESINTLNELGFITDMEHLERSKLNKKDIERYKGNLNFFNLFSTLKESHYQKQEALCDATITILGMGAFGANILIQLAGLGVKNINIVDFDEVCLSNLNRQFLFNEKSIGHFKVEEARKFIQDFNSDVRVHLYNQAISRADDIKPLIADSDFVVLAADQPYIILPREVNKACVEMGIPFIAGGLTINSGQFFTIIPYESGCVDCMHLRNLKVSSSYHQSIVGFLDSNFIPPNAATAPGLMMTTGMIVSEVMKYITNTEKLVSRAKLHKIDFITFKSETGYQWDRYEEECPTCGNGTHNTSFFQDVEKEDYYLKDVVRR
ncbi:HesA/MoeB/ThiF family protein [Ornithinibacillus xuwenensis]|uniref:ThiF family adenylyltransferase n=1 Tax=Ornithinibacillus xuwenensis TaxID=3144668 RepID=A0ABU9XGX0_9BACI